MGPNKIRWILLATQRMRVLSSMHHFKRHQPVARHGHPTGPAMVAWLTG